MNMERRSLYDISLQYDVEIVSTIPTMMAKTYQHRLPCHFYIVVIEEQQQEQQQQQQLDTLSSAGLSCSL